MSYTVRDLLEILADAHGREPLNALLDKRGLDRGRALDEKMARLARSYRGDVEAFLDDLRVSDLRTIAQDGLELCPDEEYVLPGAYRYRRDELLDILISALVHDEIPDAMELVEVEDDDEAEDDYEEDDDDADEDEVDDDADGVLWDEGEDPFPDVGHEWSRPRSIRRVMTALGWDEFERLRTQRFREVIAVARDAGFEMCVVGEEETPLLGVETTPGIHAKVRLRRAQTRGAVRVPQQESARTEVVVTRTTGQPLREVPGQASASAYELALMRLEFLTALPSLDREHSPLWPEAFVEVAVRGLELEPHQRAILGVVAQNFRRGFHDIVHVAARLRPRLAPAQWAELLAELERLNSENAALPVALAHLEGRPAPTPAAAAPVPAPRPAPPRVAPPAPPPVAEQDGRELGALEDMFD